MTTRNVRTVRAPPCLLATSRSVNEYRGASFQFLWLAATERCMTASAVGCLSTAQAAITDREIRNNCLTNLLDAIGLPQSRVFCRAWRSRSANQVVFLSPLSQLR